MSGTTQAVSMLEDALDTAPCGFLRFGEDGTVRLINRTLLGILGYEAADVVGRHVERILTVGSRIFYQTHWFPLLRMQGAAEEIFLMLRSASGEEVGALVNAVRRERDGETAYDCVLMRVRERKKYEDELLQARRTADRARAEVEAQREELSEANELLAVQAREMENQHRLLQEQAAELETAAEDLRLANDELLERTAEAERLRELAEEANRAKSTFLTVMSHELRTPLNAIAGYVELLEMGIHGPVNDPQRGALKRIARSQRHLLRLINEVLNLARIEAGRVEYEIRDVPVALLVSEVTPMIEPQLERKGIAFSTSIPAHLVARVDREKTLQILINLLGNAVKFTLPGGSVRIEAEADGSAADRLRISVSDSGIGIPPDKLESVFQPFVQVDVTHTRTEGSGLGLAISRDLARGMNGDLTAQSVPGQGSSFILTLPRSTAEEQA